MSALFEELDWRQTEIGTLSLRRRRDIVSGSDVFEILLDDAYLMSSRYTAAEIALARLGLAALPADGDGFDVVVGGLGLGYTAAAVLEDERVGSLRVIDALSAVIDWHREGLLPMGRDLTRDPRCRLLHGDFFTRVAGRSGIDPQSPVRRYHAVLVDIDHAPDNWLAPHHAAFYQPDGLKCLSGQLHPGGVFGLWSNDPPDPVFEATLADVFAVSQTHVVTFPAQGEGGEAANTVYVAVMP